MKLGYAISRRRGGRETGKRTAGVSSSSCSSSAPPGSRGERQRSSPGSAVRKTISAFNRDGVDGLVAKKRPGRKRLFPEARAEEILEEFEEPCPV